MPVQNPRHRQQTIGARVAVFEALYSISLPTLFLPSGALMIESRFSNVRADNIGSLRRSFLKGIASLPVLTALPAWFAGSRAKAEEAVDGFSTYFVKGMYFEACNCDYVCPCIF